jgi:hypothetical protein
MAVKQRKKTQKKTHRLKPNPLLVILAKLGMAIYPKSRSWRYRGDRAIGSRDGSRESSAWGLGECENLKFEI